MAQNFLISSRHGTMFYFRRRVPDDLRPIIGNAYLIKSLGTTLRGSAVVLARAYAAKTDAIYKHLRSMKKQDPEGIRFDYTLELDMDDLGIVRKMRVSAEPGESEAVESAIRTTLKNLPNQDIGKRAATGPVPVISAKELLDDFFREGIGANRWKEPQTTRRHDYDPIWAKFSPHAKEHGLTLAAVKAYRAEVLGSDLSYTTKHRNLYRVHAVMMRSFS